MPKEEDVMKSVIEARCISITALGLLILALSTALDSATHWLQLSLDIVEFTIQGQGVLTGKADSQSMNNEILKGIIDLSVWFFTLIK